MSTDNLPIQPTINIGIVGHVDHGKTTLTKLLSGKWTDTHSEEKKRGITIKLGYTNFIIYSDGNKFSSKNEDNLKSLKKVSIVDAPGHESFMATMISGAAVMDCALLLIAADEKCPQPQTIEHLKTLEIAGIKQVIVIQNKIDMVSKEEALENYQDIKKFLKGTIAQDSPIMPMSAQYGANLSELLKSIVEHFKDPQRNLDDKPLMNIVRSFDINKPGDSYLKLKGGILGGSIQKGCFSVGDEIEIKPGFAYSRDGKVFYESIYAKIEGLMSDKDKLETAVPGGSVAVMTGLDPTNTKTDSLVGQIVGLKGSLPEPLTQVNFENNLFPKVITSSGEFEVKPFVPSEPLMLIVNSLTTVGAVIKTNPKETTVSLRKPVMAFEGDRVVIFRRFEGNKWRIIGNGIIKI
ncbi:MAG: translation initiation factor IF-2 subunit gamma [Candidatus Woesearchaeota archaeon]|jgi:translation initiation factor 2 subunit 3|nr:translation initiation factor IF-2 subunit gamma [Candidatus Woesearchaeota archaeon]